MGVKKWTKTCDPKDNEAACEDFMITITDAHVLACAMELFEMDSLTDIPSKKFFPDGSSELDSVQQRNILLLAAEQLVEKCVDLSISEEKPKKEKKKQKPKEKCTLIPLGTAKRQMWWSWDFLR
jgi:hypothetical protein